MRFRRMMLIEDMVGRKMFGTTRLHVTRHLECKELHRIGKSQDNGAAPSEGGANMTSTP
jgi:hypothetical protein